MQDFLCADFDENDFDTDCGIGPAPTVWWREGDSRRRLLLLRKQEEELLLL